MRPGQSLHVVASSAIVVSVVTTVLSELSIGVRDAQQGPIQVSIVREKDMLCLSFEVINGSEDIASTAAANVAAFSGDEFGMSVSAEGTNLLLRLVIAP